MKIGGMGEEALVARIRSWLPGHERLLIGAGDDCAVLTPETGLRITKTDAMVEGVHFAPDADPVSVGWKAMGRPLSDCAAMGGTPTDALITLGLRPDVELDWVEAFYEGAKRAARCFDVAVAGGETTSSGGGPLWISVAMNGRVDRPVRRSGGKPGQAIWVTGVLGGSIAGHHLNFMPRIKEAAWLQDRVELGAMMDLSDGMARDLPRLARESQCGWAVEPNRLPLRPGCTVSEALGDGEDYELLFTTFAESWADEWPRHFPDTRLTRIGWLREAGVEIGLDPRAGWEHFQP